VTCRFCALKRSHSSGEQKETNVGLTSENEIEMKIKKYFEDIGVQMLPIYFQRKIIFLCETAVLTGDYKNVSLGKACSP
jgi:hypothetical protein